MRISSKTGYRGVEKTKGKYVAFYLKAGDRKTLGKFDQIEDAARAVDLECVKRRGIIAAFSIGLNLEPTAELKAAYAAEVARVESLERMKAENAEASLRSTVIPESANRDLVLRHLAGESTDSIGRSYHSHGDVVADRLRTLMSEGNEKLNFAPCVSGTTITADAIKNQVKRDFATGVSIRKISERYELPRKLIAAWVSLLR